MKRWVLFPPHVPKAVVKGRRLLLPGEDDEAIHYFTTILPRMKRRAAAAAARAGGKAGYGSGEDDDPYADFVCYEFTQVTKMRCFVHCEGFCRVPKPSNLIIVIARTACRRDRFCPTRVVARCPQRDGHSWDHPELLQPAEF